MDHSTVLQKLPSSIYTKEADSNNAKLWNLYSSEANLIENSLIPFYDVNSLSGINLDKMSLILGIEREGMNDVDYRNALLNFQDVEVDTASLPALYDCLEGLKTVGLLTQYKITELGYEREMEEDLLDGNGFCDGLGDLTPGLRPKIVEFCDGDGTLDGLEPLEPYFIRPASILIEVETGNLHLPEIVLEARKVLIAGIGIYIRDTV
jgi:hypothetical protein